MAIHIASPAHPARQIRRTAQRRRITTAFRPRPSRTNTLNREDRPWSQRHSILPRSSMRRSSSPTILRSCNLLALSSMIETILVVFQEGKLSGGIRRSRLAALQ